MVADQKKITPLLKTARGQIDGLLRMVEENRYCIDISNQILAVQSILDKVNQEILRAHLYGCVRSAFESGDEAIEQQRMDEIVDLFKKLSR